MQKSRGEKRPDCAKTHRQKRVYALGDVNFDWNIWHFMESDIFWVWKDKKELHFPDTAVSV